MKVIIRLSLFFCFLSLFNCLKNKDKNEEGLIQEINHQLNENDSIWFNSQTMYNECGEWGGHLERILIYKSKNKSIQGKFITYRFNCDSIEYYYNLKIKDLPIKSIQEIPINYELFDNLNNYRNKAIEIKEQGMQFVTHAEYSHLIILNHDTIDYYGSKLLNDYEDLKSKIIP